MMLTRLKRTLPLLAAAAILAGCAPTQLPTPVAPYESRNVGVMVTGPTVLATMQIRTVAGTVAVDNVGICVDGGSDFPMGGRTITQSWLTVSSTRRFPPGQYTARACVTDGGRGQVVAGPSVTFTVN